MSKTDGAPLLQAKNLTYIAGGKNILSDINFSIESGERIAFFGPSGAGKSTLIRLLNRLDEPTSGTVLLEGQDYRQVPPRTLRRRLGLVMQRPYLFPGTVAANIRYGPAARGEDMSDDEIENLLAGVDLDGYASRDVSKLSGGEAQRVSLARTLANKPEVLLLDEPTSSLDDAAQREVEETILSVLESQQVTCILVSHNQRQVKRLADRVLVLKGGELVGHGPVEEVLDAHTMD